MSSKLQLDQISMDCVPNALAQSFLQKHFPSFADLASTPAEYAEIIASIGNKINDPIKFMMEVCSKKGNLSVWKTFIALCK